MTVVFDGNEFAKKRLEILRQRVAGLERKPRLVSVVFAQDEMGLVYARLKAEAAAEVGIEFEKVVLKFDDSNHRTMEVIRDLCARPEVDGVLIQKPSKLTTQNVHLRQSFDGQANVKTKITNYAHWWEEISEGIDPKKDVDCLTRENLDKVYQGASDFLPATARAVVSILDDADRYTSGRLSEVVVVGRSELVGRPLTAYLKGQMSKVIMLGSQDNLREYLPTADVVVSATGQPNLITGEMVKEGAVVVDVGEPRGDVEFASVVKKASFITPVPGGVGPVTVVSLLENLVDMIEYISY